MNLWVEAGICLVALAVFMIVACAITNHSTAAETLTFLIILCVGVVLVGIGETQTQQHQLENCWKQGGNAIVRNECVDLQQRPVPA